MGLHRAGHTAVIAQKQTDMKGFVDIIIKEDAFK